MFKNFADSIPSDISAPDPRPAVVIEAQSIGPAALPRPEEDACLKAEIARREASLAKEEACEHINLLRVRRVTRELTQLRRRLLMLGRSDTPRAA